MWNAVWRGVLAAKRSQATIIGFAGFRESVVSTVKVFALLSLCPIRFRSPIPLHTSTHLQLLVQEILLVRKLSVHAKETLLLG